MFADLSSLIAHNPPGLHGGVGVFDADGDGRFEFVVAGDGGPNRVLKWKGEQLRDLRVPALADEHRRAVGLAAGDLDGDGDEELYVLNDETEDRLWKRLPDGRWENLFDRLFNAVAGNPAAGRGVVAIDRRGVGRYSFFVANVGRRMRLYELGPDDTLADLAPWLGLNELAGGCAALAVPIFGDATDLFCGNEGGPNFLFRNLGDGTFEECAERLGLSDPGEHARGMAAVDADGDGRLDLCWGNSDGPHRLMVRRPDDTWKDRATAGLAFPSTVRTVIAADFDNDGRDELFFNNLGEPNRLFRIIHSESGNFDVHMLDPLDALEPDGLGTGAAVADIDGDGVLELLVAHGESAPQPLSLYRSRSAAGNGWLRVQPLTRFGAPARGVVVRADIGGRVQVKPIGSSGYLCQMEPVAHFGLGREPRVDRVTVTWPDGAAVVLEDPGTNRTITVPFPRG
jgi:hypothetical protein